MSILKEQYNILLIRHDKAVRYLNDPNIPLGDKEIWIAEFGRILKRMQEVLLNLKEKGVDYTAHEVIYGFEIGGDG